MSRYLFLVSVICLHYATAVRQLDSFSTEGERIKQNFLDHLNFKNIPRFSEEEFDNIQVPLHMKMRYQFLARQNHAKFKLEAQGRQRRSSLPSLAELFNKVHKNSNKSGNFVYLSTFREQLRFDMEGKIPERSRITVAQLRLFKKLPNFNRRVSTNFRIRVSPHTNRHPKKLSKRPPTMRHAARVSVYHTLVHEDGSEKSTLIDSRIIMVNGSGWQSFDVTKAVKQWQKHPVKYMSITLELRIEGSRPGRTAAEIARMVRFTGQQASSKSPRRPELVVFTEEEEQLKSNDCQNSRHSNKKCCREKHYVNFREMEWTNHWIIEPSGYEAFKCTGRCSPSRRRTSPGLPRSCAVSERSPLAVMYLVKRGNSTQVEISEFPNMIVEKCGCSLDSLYVV